MGKNRKWRSTSNSDSSNQMHNISSGSGVDVIDNHSVNSYKKNLVVIEKTIHNKYTARDTLIYSDIDDDDEKIISENDSLLAAYYDSSSSV